MKLAESLKRNLPTILSVVASVGVVATFILTARKAEEVTQEIEELDEPTVTDELKVYGKAYAPAIAVGLVTIICVIFSNKLNKKQQASLVGAYMLSYKQFERYKQKLKDIYGEEAHQRVIDALAVESADSPDIYAPGIMSANDRKIREPGKTRLFYDRYGDRYFASTIEAVMDAEYHLNRNYVLGGHVTLNEFYIFLGLEGIENGDKLGWDGYYEHEGIFWLDFNHDIVEVPIIDDQTVDCVVIDMPFEPCLLDESYLSSW